MLKAHCRVSSLEGLLNRIKTGYWLRSRRFNFSQYPKSCISFLNSFLSNDQYANTSLHRTYPDSEFNVDFAISLIGNKAHSSLRILSAIEFLSANYAELLFTKMLHDEDQSQIIYYFYLKLPHSLSHFSNREHRALSSSYSG